MSGHHKFQERRRRAAPRWYSLTDRRLLIIFILLVSCFSYIFWQDSKQDAQVQRNSNKIAETSYQTCLTFNTSHKKFNAVIQAGIVKEKAKEHPRKKVIRQLGDLKLPIFHCVKPRVD